MFDVTALGELLIEKETLTREEFVRFMNEAPVPAVAEGSVE